MGNQLDLESIIKNGIEYKLGGHNFYISPLDEQAKNYMNEHLVKRQQTAFNNSKQLSMLQMQQRQLITLIIAARILFK